MAAVTFKSVPSPMTTENVTNRTVKAPPKTGQNAAPGGIAGRNWHYAAQASSTRSSGCRDAASFPSCAPRGQGPCGCARGTPFKVRGIISPAPSSQQAAAFFRISFSSRRTRFSRRSRRSSSFSSVVRPSVRVPSSRSAWRTQFQIDCAVGSNSRDSESGVRASAPHAPGRPSAAGTPANTAVGSSASCSPPQV